MVCCVEILGSYLIHWINRCGEKDSEVGRRIRRLQLSRFRCSIFYPYFDKRVTKLSFPEMQSQLELSHTRPTMARSGSSFFSLSLSVCHFKHTTAESLEQRVPFVLLRRTACAYGPRHFATYPEPSEFSVCVWRLVGSPAHLLVRTIKNTKHSSHWQRALPAVTSSAAYPTQKGT